MLIDTRTLEPDMFKRFQRWGFAGVVAECPETGAHLTIGNGKRKAGRPRRYFIKVAVSLLPAGYHDQEQVGTVTALYDEDAITKANERLEKITRIRSIHE